MVNFCCNPCDAFPGSCHESHDSFRKGRHFTKTLLNIITIFERFLSDRHEALCFGGFLFFTVFVVVFAPNKRKFKLKKDFPEKSPFS